MSKEYAPLAAQIIELVGGSENISSAYHCQTRLRFVLADESQANPAALEATDGVVKALSSGGMFQVVIGTQVPKLYAKLPAALRG